MWLPVVNMPISYHRAKKVAERRTNAGTEIDDGEKAEGTHGVGSFSIDNAPFELLFGGSMLIFRDFRLLQ